MVRIAKARRQHLGVTEEQIPELKVPVNQLLTLDRVVRQRVGNDVLGYAEKVNENTEKYTADNITTPDDQAGFDKWVEANEKALTAIQDKVPSSQKQFFKDEVDKINKKHTEGLNRWRLIQSIKNNQVLTEKLVEKGYERAATFGKEQIPLETLDIETQRAVIKKQELPPEIEAQYMEGFEQDMVVNYLGGLIETNPTEALRYLKDEKVKETVGNKFESELTSKAKRRINYMTSAQNLDNLSGVMLEFDLTAQQYKNQGASVVQINQYVEDNNLSEGDKTFLLDKAGYSTGGRSGSRFSLEQKQQAKSGLINKSAKLATGKDTTLEMYEELRKEAVKMANEGRITEETYNNINELWIYPYASLAKSTMNEYINNGKYTQQGIEVFTKIENDLKSVYGNINKLTKQQKKDYQLAYATQIEAVVREMDNYVKQSPPEDTTTPSTIGEKPASFWTSLFRSPRFMEVQTKAYDKVIKNNAEGMGIKTEGKSTNDIKDETNLKIKENDRKETQELVDNSYKPVVVNTENTEDYVGSFF
jgi:hypothetical protein